MQGNERLGRRLTEAKGKDSRTFKHIQKALNSGASKKSVIPPKLFNPPTGETEVSVDRLSLAPINTMANIARQSAGYSHRVFYGWAVVLCEIARQGNIEVCPSPMLDEIPPNPYHANLVFPDSIYDSSDKTDNRLEYTYYLARNSEWYECPKQK